MYIGLKKRREQNRNQEEYLCHFIAITICTNPFTSILVQINGESMYPNYPMQTNARNGSIQSDHFRHPARSSLRSTSMVFYKFIIIFVLFIPSSQYTSKEGKKKKRKCPNQPSGSSVSEPWASAWPPISSTKATPCTATTSSLPLSSGFRRQGASRHRRFGRLQRTSHFMYAWLPLLRRHRRRFLGRRVLCNVCTCMQTLIFSLYSPPFQ